MEKYDVIFRDESIWSWTQDPTIKIDCSSKTVCQDTVSDNNANTLSSTKEFVKDYTSDIVHLDDIPNVWLNNVGYDNWRVDPPADEPIGSQPSRRCSALGYEFPPIIKGTECKKTDNVEYKGQNIFLSLPDVSDVLERQLELYRHIVKEPYIPPRVYPRQLSKSPLIGQGVALSVANYQSGITRHAKTTEYLPEDDNKETITGRNTNKLDMTSQMSRHFGVHYTEIGQSYGCEKNIEHGDNIQHADKTSSRTQTGTATQLKLSTEASIENERQIAQLPARNDPQPNWNTANAAEDDKSNEDTESSSSGTCSSEEDIWEKLFGIAKLNENNNSGRLLTVLLLRRGRRVQDSRDQATATDL